MRTCVVGSPASRNAQNGGVTNALYVLVGGWPASGKSTLAGGLAMQLQLPLLSKDEIKEAMARRTWPALQRR